MLKIRLTILTSILFISLALITQAQNINPGPKKIYKEDEIAIVSITMDPADKAWMLAEENKWSDIYQTATFSFKNSDIDTTLTFNVGIRLRGNTSRNHPKKSFKIKFKEFGGEKFYDLKKFNLKAEVNDPTMLREMLSLKAFRDLDVPAARSHHAEVYINGEYMGLYLNVEQIDDEFVQRRFTYNMGNIYKCYWGATLANDGQIFNNDIYELETNKELNDRSKLDNFVKVLNNTPSSSFITEIEKVFDVDRYIRYLAVEALIGHWDGYSYNKNNFYLYENDSTGLVEFIAYDVDNSFGIDWVSRDWGTRDILDWVKHGDPRPLATKILAQSAYYERYRRYIDQLLKTSFSTGSYYPIFDAYEVTLADAVGRDTYYPQPFGYTVSNYHTSYDDALPEFGHLPYGLKSYVATRSTTARDQLGVVLASGSDFEKPVSVYPNPVSNGRVIIDSPGNISELALQDLSGRFYQVPVRKISNNRSEAEISVPAGIYILRINDQVRKIAVE